MSKYATPDNTNYRIGFEQIPDTNGYLSFRVYLLKEIVFYHHTQITCNLYFVST